MEESQRKVISTVLGCIPSGVYILTAQHEDRRLGMLASWVQQVCFEPPMVSVAVAKGRAIMPLISESRRLALCQIGEDDKLLQRKFANTPDINDDPFLGFDLVPGYFPGLPILRQTSGFLECELACHMDVEGDHDLFVGKVVNAGYNAGRPLVHLREDGFAY